MTRRSKSGTENRGGPRPGAGRPRGSGPYGEPTRPLRVPESLVVPIRELLERRLAVARSAAEARDPRSPGPHEGDLAAAENVLFPDFGSELSLPLFGYKVAAGFPSPADDHLEKTLDLNRHLVRHPSATFFVRVQGDSMTGAGINAGDILVVDRAQEAVDGKIVIAALDGELTVKRLRTRDGKVVLEPENPIYRPLAVTDEMNFVIWGVVTSVVHEF